MPPCLARVSKVWLKFGDGKHRFLTENICGHICDSTEQRCADCLKPKQIKTQDCRTFDHGLLNGDFTKESHMFDSPWFHMALEKYGPPKANDLQLAMEIQQKARAAASLTAVIVSKPVAPSSSTVEKPKKQKEEKQANETKDTKAPKVKKTATPTEKKPRGKKSTLKDVETVSIPVEENRNVIEVISKADVLIESQEEPQRILNVIRVILRPFQHKGVQYWRDGERDKVYKRASNGKRGAYVGRWDNDIQQIHHDAPDSDDE